MRHELREPELIEPALVTDVFVSGMLEPEDLGDIVRVTFYVDHHVGVLIERITAARIVWSKAAFLAAHGKVKAFAARNAGKVVPITR